MSFIQSKRGGDHEKQGAVYQGGKQPSHPLMVIPKEGGGSAAQKDGRLVGR